jgi:glyoxylase-like metal-dependent hydrolase (beta-lactamase superfamily II)
MPEFDRTFEPFHGQSVSIARDVRRVTANNPSAFTFHGTNSYIIGNESLAIIDPGPDDSAHLAALLAAIGDRPVSHILISHTHRDHSPLATRLKKETGAILVGEGPHRPARPRRAGEDTPLDSSGDVAFRPDLRLGDGEAIEGDGWTLRAVHTPGHTANHLAFSLEGTDILFSADHVMAWSTTIVAPPDGSMSDYMASLDKLLGRDDRIFFPGHGGPVTAPQPFLRGLKAHRKMRERAIVERIHAGDRRTEDIVRAIYRDTDPRLFGAAGLSVLAHIEDLVQRKIIVAEGEVSLEGKFHPA